MVVKLKSVWRNPRLQSALRPLTFALLLFNVWWLDFSFLAVVIYLIVNFLIYIYPLLNSRAFVASFAVLLFLSLTTLVLVANHFWYVPAAIFILSTFYYLVLGLKNLYLVEKDRWHYFLNLGMFYLTFFLFFVRTADYFLVKIIFLFLISFFLLRENFKKNNPSLVISLLITELAWAISWLPISFVISTNLLFLVTYLIKRFIDTD